MTIQYPSVAYRELLGPESEFAADNPQLWGKLANAMADSRSYAGKIASAIRTENPWLTDHSVDHLDALWQMVDLFIEPKDINVCEAFFLGLTFMFHDLGNTTLVHGRRDIKNTPLYTALVKQLRRGSPDMADEDIHNLANFHYLRSTHAKQVEDIAVRDWSLSGESFHLLDERSLRTTFGAWIGLVCRSHNDSIESVVQEFGTVGSISPPAEFPQSLKVDLLKMACLLRMCDAAHVDYRRASKIERVLRGSMPSMSKKHWEFQERLSLPTLDVSSSLIRYVSNREFRTTESESWWTCYDYLGMVDRELRNCHETLLEKSDVKTKAGGVFGAGNPAQLSVTVKCNGWLPAEMTVTAASASMLVELFAGGYLYGNKPEVAIRELVQNSRDAIAAYRAIAGLHDDWGAIKIEVRKKTGGLRDIILTDNGLGMTRDTVQRFLLTLGRSLWSDMALVGVSPELVNSDFEAVGRYGIGWFSVFLLSNHVLISTRHYTASQDGTVVILFTDGVKSRPILLNPDAETQLHLSGTRIEIFGIQEDTWSRLIGSSHGFGMLVGTVCPATDVDIEVLDGEDSYRMRASDWKTIDPHLLFARILGVKSLDHLSEPDYAHSIAERFRSIYGENGEIIGRLALDLQGQGTNWGGEFGTFVTRTPNVLVAGGFQNGNVGSDIAGIVFGASVNVLRSEGQSSVSSESFRAWIESQLGIAPPARWNATSYALICHACGREELDEAAVCYTSEGPMTISEVKRWAKERNRVLLSFSVVLPRDINDGILHGLTYHFPNSWIYQHLDLVYGSIANQDLSQIANATSAKAVCAVLESWDILMREGCELDALRTLIERLDRGTTRLSRSDPRETNVVHILDRSKVGEILLDFTE